MKKAYIIFSFAILLIVFSNMVYKIVNYENNNIKNAVLYYDKKEGTKYLDGQWEFYYNQLLTFDDIKAMGNVDKSHIEYIDVPGVWNSKNKYRDTAYGYATYILKVKGENMGEMALKIMHMSCAYKIMINHKVIGESGNVDPNQFREGFKPQILSFEAPNQEFYIIIQVSNYFYPVSGIWYSILLGPEELIQEKRVSANQKEMFLIGAILVVIIRHLLNFILEKKKENVLFMFFCLSSIIRILTSGEHNITAILPNITLEQVEFLYYMVIIWAIVFLTGFIISIFEAPYSKIIYKILLLNAVFCSALVVLTRPQIYIKLLYKSYALIIGLASIYILIILFKEILNNKKEAYIIMQGVLIIIICYVHDIAYNSQIKIDNLGEIIPFGTIIFILLITYYNEINILNNKRKTIQMEAAFLQTQMKPHFLFNVLNVIITYCYEDGKKAAELLTDFTQYLRGTFKFNNLQQLIQLEEELDYIKTYLNIQKARYDERLNFQVINEAHLLNILIPPLMIQPLVENAILHGILKKNEGGTVKIYIKLHKKGIRVSVEDDGVGINKENLDTITHYKKDTKSVALYNINHRLRGVYGSSLEIESEINKGTKVSFIISQNVKISGN